VRDAVKKKAPKDLPKPGKFKLADNESTAPVSVGQDAPAGEAASAAANPGEGA
jgi:hypothetical protein